VLKAHNKALRSIGDPPKQRSWCEALFDPVEIGGRRFLIEILRPTSLGPARQE